MKVPLNMDPQVFMSSNNLAPYNQNIYSLQVDKMYTYIKYYLFIGIHLNGS